MDALETVSSRMSFFFNNVLYNALKICLESEKTKNIQNTVERYVIPF